MVIKYLGHSCFMLVTSEGTRIVTDPYSPDIGYSMPKVTADCVTISHHHYDHDAVKLVHGCKEVFEGACEKHYKDVKISSFKCFHDEVKGAKRGVNYAFKFEADGVTVVHLGDLGEYKNDALCKWARGCDVLLVPVGGNYTIDGKTAASYVNNINPRFAVPMHYAMEGGIIDISGPEEFLNLFPGSIKVPEFSVPANENVNKKIIIIERI